MGVGGKASKKGGGMRGTFSGGGGQKAVTSKGWMEGKGGLRNDA